MKLTPGRASYKLETGIVLLKVAIPVEHGVRILPICAIDTMPTSTVRGIPACCCFDRGFIRFWPVPDQAYEAKITYALEI